MKLLCAFVLAAVAVAAWAECEISDDQKAALRAVKQNCRDNNIERSECRDLIKAAAVEAGVSEECMKRGRGRKHGGKGKGRRGGNGGRRNRGGNANGGDN